MFDHTSHDFGTVARGAKVEHRFTLENIYVEDAHIASARASCGCTTPEITKAILKTWEKAEIVAKVDTRGLPGAEGRHDHGASSTGPFPAEVQLQIHCYIRSDVVVQPGVVQFGTVAQGSRRPAAGRRHLCRPQRLADPPVECATTRACRPRRSRRLARRGQVAYDLVVDLSPTPRRATFRDQVFLVTNDANPRAARVPVPVEGVVQSGITVHPSPLFMGMVEPGSPITRQLVVRGGSPFRITRGAVERSAIPMSGPRAPPRCTACPSRSRPTTPGKVRARSASRPTRARAVRWRWTSPSRSSRAGGQEARRSANCKKSLPFSWFPRSAWGPALFDAPRRPRRRRASRRVRSHGGPRERGESGSLLSPDTLFLVQFMRISTDGYCKRCGRDSRRLRAGFLRIARQGRARRADPASPHRDGPAAVDPRPSLPAGRSDRPVGPAGRQLPAQRARPRRTRSAGRSSSAASTSWPRRPTSWPTGPSRLAARGGRARRGRAARHGGRLLDGRHGRRSSRSRTAGSNWPR